MYDDLELNMTSPKAHIVVLGAGVIGLTTGIKLLEEGYNVSIVASCLPGDEKSIHYCSPWAGAHHVCTYGVNAMQKAMESETFKIMWNMSEPSHPAYHCFKRIPQWEYYVEAKSVDEMNLRTMPGFRMLEPSELVQNTEQGVYFETVTIDTSQYLPYLLSRFLSLGGKTYRHSIQHISQLLSSLIPGPPASAIIVCTGLGARYLGGVEDQKVHPVRGQVVTVKAPHIDFGRTMASMDGTWTYIIPRSSGDVILGGYKTSHDWTSIPLPSHTTSILTRALLLAPELVPVSARADPEKPTVEELRGMVVEEGCGLRPAREGGIRLEWEEVEVGGERTVLVHHYGHGGSGYQSSFGSANMCVKMLKESLATPSQ